MYLSFLFCFKVFLLVVNQFFILSLLQDILIFSMDILDKSTVFFCLQFPLFAFCILLKSFYIVIYCSDEGLFDSVLKLFLKLFKYSHDFNNHFLKQLFHEGGEYYAAKKRTSFIRFSL